MSTRCGEKNSLHASERDTPRAVAQRQDFVETVAQHYDTRRFHFLNETGLRFDACRRYARVRGGQRVGQAVPLRRGPSLTLIGTLSSQGLGEVQLFEGATLRALREPLPSTHVMCRRCVGTRQPGRAEDWGLRE